MPTKKTSHAVMRPNIYGYHTYREFLEDWFDFMKKSRSSFSLRRLAKSAELTASYLTMVRSGARRLTLRSVDKLSPHLGLSAIESEFLRALVNLGNARTQSERLSALTQMRQFKGYRAANPKEAEVHEYLTHWYYVAIREMTALPDFSPDPSWIKKRLRFPVNERALRTALNFLLDNGYIDIDAAGNAYPPKKDMLCIQDVYLSGIRQFHKEALELSIRSLDETPVDERFMMAYTLPIQTDRLHEARKVIEKAVSDLQKLASRTDNADEIFHAEFALFPLTQASGDQND